MLFQVLALSGLASVARAHMVMANPIPYGVDSLDNSPLKEDASDFPCKQRTGVYATSGSSNVYAQGSEQSLEFKGSAVHGGGSCQLSVTTDKEPTKDSVWKVIKSIEGGCPAQGSEGNLPTDPNGSGASKYKFTIPSELAAGEYTLAWTWYNKVGNREMYMNCAPMEITGSGGSDTFLDSLPDMFVANIGPVPGRCGTKPNEDVVFPDPGKDVDRFNGATDAFGAPTGNCPKATGGGGGSAPTAQPTDGGGQPTGGQPSATAAPTAAPTAADPSIPGGVFITVSAPGGDAPAVTTPTAPTTPTAEPEKPTAEQPAPSTPATNPDDGSGSPDTPSGGFAAGTACTSEGDWNCVGGTSFQRCASGIWSALQAVSSGSKCTPGQSAELGLAVKRGTYAMRRGLRFRA